MRVVKTFVAIGLTVPAWTTYAEMLNLDFGGSVGTPPSSAYGAGSGQAGFWEPNSFGNLRDTTGGVTAVTMGTSGGGAGSFNIPGATGDDKRLMESALAFSGTGSSFSLQHVTPGSYDCYIYSWGGTQSGTHNVTFTASNGTESHSASISYSGGWPGGQALGVTYCRVPVTVSASQVVIVQMFFSSGADIVNGFQLVPVPAPGVGAIALGACGVLAARRRR